MKNQRQHRLIPQPVNLPSIRREITNQIQIEQLRDESINQEFSNESSSMKMAGNRNFWRDRQKQPPRQQNPVKVSLNPADQQENFE